MDMKKIIIFCFVILFSIIAIAQKGNIWRYNYLKPEQSYYDSYFLEHRNDGNLFLNINDTIVFVLRSSFTGFDILISTKRYCKNPSTKICKVYYKLFDCDEAKFITSCNTFNDTLRLSASNIKGRYLYISLYTEDALIINRRIIKFWQ
jgi:hypothetical protein